MTVTQKDLYVTVQTKICNLRLLTLPLGAPFPDPIIAVHNIFRVDVYVR